MAFSAALVSATFGAKAVDSTSNLAPAFHLTLAVDLAQRLGIAAEALTAQVWAAEREAVGRVVSIAPLLTLRAAELARDAELTSIERAVAEHEAYLARLDAQQKAGAAGGLSERHAVSVALAELAGRRGALTAQAVAAHGALRLEWGDALAHAVLDAESTVLASLKQDRAVLIKVEFGAETANPGLPGRARVALGGRRETSVEALLLDRAPATSRWGGATYWFTARDATLPSGAEISAWVATGDSETGVRIPARAVIWLDGRQWVYVQVTPTGYERREVALHALSSRAYFTSDLTAATHVVTVGAQALLAQEQRAAIPREDND
ncbi:MAG: hypothetical protein HYX63_17125 [Gammaproteobacteria bacterium]|nr:hypothetical protein [Gammaproteobacteria bacterium]